jgi:hypothetical protein
MGGFLLLNTANTTALSALKNGLFLSVYPASLIPHAVIAGALLTAAVAIVFTGYVAGTARRSLAVGAHRGAARLRVGVPAALRPRLAQRVRRLSVGLGGSGPPAHARMGLRGRHAYRTPGEADSAPHRRGRIRRRDLRRSRRSARGIRARHGEPTLDLGGAPGAGAAAPVGESRSRLRETEEPSRPRRRSEGVRHAREPRRALRGDQRAPCGSWPSVSSRSR